MKFFALNTDVSSHSKTALNSIVFSSKKHVLTPNIHFSLPQTKYHYYYNKLVKMEIFLIKWHLNWFYCLSFFTIRPLIRTKEMHSSWVHLKDHNAMIQPSQSQKQLNFYPWWGHQTTNITILKYKTECWPLPHPLYT